MGRSEFTQQPFDGKQPRIPGAEQVAAGKIFKKTIDTLFVEHEQDVKNALLPAIQPDVLPLKLTTDTKSIDLLAYRTRDPASGKTGKHKLDRTVETHDAKTKETSEYALDPSGIVRRYDKNNSISFSPPEGAPESFEEFLARGISQYSLYDEIANRLLERKMGVNDQPLGLREITVILAEAKKAEPPA